MVAAAIFCCLASVGQLSELTIDSVRLSADRILLEPTSGVARAEGHVLLRSDDYWVTADAAEFDQERQVAEVSGRVTVSGPGRLVHGSDGLFDFATSRGELNHAWGWDETSGARLIVKGSQLIFEGSEWRLLDAEIRLSEKSDAHYRLTASEIRFTQDQSWWGKDVVLRIFGVTVLRQSEYRQHTTDPPLAALQWVPVPGVNDQDGAFVQWSLERTVLGDLHLSGYGRAGTSAGVVGRIRASYPVGSRGSVWGIAGYRELVGDLVRPYLRWTRTEVGTGWRLTGDRSSWRSDVSLSYGTVQELPTEARSTRGAVMWTATSKPFSSSRVTRTYAAVGANGYAYGGGATYGDLWGGLFWSHRFTRDTRLSAAGLAHAVAGETPFETDRVEMPLELRLGARLGLTSNWSAEADVRYDVLESRVRHTELSLRYRSADFVYRMRYNTERGFFAVDLLLPD